MLEINLPEEISFLDNIEKLLKRNEVGLGITKLIEHLYQLNKKLDENTFNKFVHNIALQHPVKNLIHQDPYAHRSFTKPRGYPGDAELLDFCYGFNGPKKKTTPLGREIFKVSMARSAIESIRYRSSLLAKIIDEIALQNSSAKILSIACGHFREALLSKAVQTKAIDSLIGFDQDEASINLILSEMKNFPIEAYVRNLRSIIRRKELYETFDFIYTAGLSDYLKISLAKRLTASMFKMLKSGGRLLVTNFAPETEERGYMETFMNWHLNYRDENLVSSFSMEISSEDLLNQKIYRDPFGNVIYLEIFKR